MKRKNLKSLKTEKLPGKTENWYELKLDGSDIDSKPAAQYGETQNQQQHHF
jgi:hypothetical protein